LVTCRSALADRKLLDYNQSGVFTKDEERLQMATRKSLAGQKTDRRVGRQWLTIRVSPEVRRELEDAARFSGRSISAEAEQRVEAGLAGERHFTEVLAQAAGVQGSALLELVAYVVRQEGDWLDDATAFAAVRKRIDFLLDAVAPPARPTPPGEPEGDPFASPEFTEVVALLARLFKLNPNAVWYRWGGDLQKRLGGDVTRRIMHWVAERQV
jgi:hypothetical protein